MQLSEPQLNRVNFIALLDELEDERHPRTLPNCTEAVLFRDGGDHASGFYLRVATNLSSPTEGFGGLDAFGDWEVSLGRPLSGDDPFLGYIFRGAVQQLSQWGMNLNGAGCRQDQWQVDEGYCLQCPEGRSTDGWNSTGPMLEVCRCLPGYVEVANDTLHACVDVEPPVFPDGCGGNITASVRSPYPGRWPDIRFPTPRVTDNSGQIDFVRLRSSDPPDRHLGKQRIIWRAKDLAGNVAECRVMLDIVVGESLLLVCSCLCWLVCFVSALDLPRLRSFSCFVLTR